MPLDNFCCFEISFCSVGITEIDLQPDMRHIVSAFKLSCVIAATFMIAYWMHKFHKNDYITLIEYKLVENLKDMILPELSVVVLNMIMLL